MKRWLIRLAVASALVFAGGVYAIATISNSLNKIIVPGTGAQTAFTFPFVGVAASDISVIYTTASGVQTTLAQGPGATQYQVALNAAVSPSLWGVGGTVTYNPSGTPIAAGTTLTITRTLPYTQLTSLQNQASFGQLAQATEMALDQLEMQIQQIAEAVGRVVQAPTSDAAGLNYTLPAAAARANLALCFDGSGNVIACATPASGIISSAMQPVVSAASLAAGRTALGLGSAATGTMNFGLQSGVSGAGNIDVNSTPVADSTNQAVTTAFHQTQRICTGPITYTLPRANTAWAGFGFWVYAVSGLCTITPNAADNFLGLASATSISVPPGSWLWLTTSAAASGVWWVDYHGPTNSNLVAGVGASALTFTFYSGPLQFRDTTLANGDPVWSLPANGIAITVPSTATLGTSSSNVPFRVWIFAAYNGGTPVLGVAVCSIATSIYPCAAWETLRKTGTGITAGSTSAGVLYTSAGVTNDSVIVVGYADYASGLATAGTWASTPTTLQLCLPPRQCKKPGDVIQMAYSATDSVAITPTSAINLIEFLATSTGSQVKGAAGFTTLFKRASTTLYSVTTAGCDDPGAGSVYDCTTNFAASLLDAPATASSVTYSSATTGETKATSFVKEIMGALDPPANDNFLTPQSKAA